MCIVIATYATSMGNICNIHLKRMKHTVATCARLLDAPQWRLLYVELEVTHSQQADGLRHGRRHKAQARVHNARHEACDTRRGGRRVCPVLGAHEAQGARREARCVCPVLWHEAQGMGASDARHGGRRVRAI
jgi:hypothetical protein